MWPVRKGVRGRQEYVERRVEFTPGIGHIAQLIEPLSRFQVRPRLRYPAVDFYLMGSRS
jgi:hypothetical protein